MGVSGATLSSRAGADQRGQENVPEPVETDGVEIVVGEVELEAAAEVLDVAFELGPAQRRDGCDALLETSTRIHGRDLQKIG